MTVDPPGALRRFAARLTPKRITVWGMGLLAVSWFTYLHTIMVPGLADRVGRVKGTDYVQFYVMGSLVLDGRFDALYDPGAHLDQGRRRIDPNLHVFASHPNYGPQVALAFAPLALLPYVWSLGAFIALSLLCYSLSIWIVWRECESLRQYGGLVALLAAASPLLFATMRYGQASAFALLMVSAAFVALRRGHTFAAGLALGCLVYKPQLGVVFGVAMLTAAETRVVAGAAASAVGQLLVAWVAAGSASMTRYAAQLWTLLLDPELVELYPTELHSVRGFFRLLIPSRSAVTVLSIAALVVIVALAIRTWRGAAPLGLRWSALVLVTVLASPHLITYDLLLLTLPLMLCADWAARPDNADHELRPGVIVLLALLYFAPFSGQLLARLTRIQLSVIAMALLAWRIYHMSAEDYPPIVRRPAPTLSSVSGFCDYVAPR